MFLCRKYRGPPAASRKSWDTLGKLRGSFQNPQNYKSRRWDEYGIYWRIMNGCRLVPFLTNNAMNDLSTMKQADWLAVWCQLCPVLQRFGPKLHPTRRKNRQLLPAIWTNLIVMNRLHYRIKYISSWLIRYKYTPENAQKICWFYHLFFPFPFESMFKRL